MCNLYCGQDPRPRPDFVEMFGSETSDRALRQRPLGLRSSGQEKQTHQIGHSRQFVHGKEGLLTIDI